MIKIREDGATSGIRVLASLSYDGLGRRASLTRGNGTSTGYRYDPVSRLSQLAQTMSAAQANNLTQGFDYNPASQIVLGNRSNNAYEFTRPTSAGARFRMGSIKW